VFELAGVGCRPCPEPLARKRCAAAAPARAPSPHKVGGKRRRKASSRSGDTNLQQGRSLAEPVELGKKWGVLGSCAQSSGLSVVEKTSLAKVPDHAPVGVVIGSRKRHPVSAAGPRAVSLLGSSSSEEDGGTREPYRK
jgi:hypothetical protein